MHIVANINGSLLAAAVTTWLWCLVGPWQPVLAEIHFAPAEQLETPITISARQGQHWREGAYEVWSLGGDCQITQGGNRVTGNELVLWIENVGTPTQPHWRMMAYAEGQVTLIRGPATGTAQPTLQPSDQQTTAAWLGRFSSWHEPRIQTQLVSDSSQRNRVDQPPGPQQGNDNPAASSPKVASSGGSAGQLPRPAIYERAWNYWALPATGTGSNQPIFPAPPGPQTGPILQPAAEDAVTADPATEQAIQRTQFAEFNPDPRQFPVTGPVATSAGPRRVQFFPRSAVPLQIDFQQSPGGVENILTINSGVQVRIDGVAGTNPALGNLGTIDLSADRVVVWYQGNLAEAGDGLTQAGDAPLEIYLEGDIVFREGDRVIYAQAMYYNVRLRNGVILNAELLTPVRNYAGLVRLRTNVLRQLDESRFAAEGASLTTSRLAMPTYEFRAGELTIVDNQVPLLDPRTGQPAINALTGEQLVDHQQQVTSTNNVVLAGGVPVFYWPRLVTDLENPTYFVEDVNIGNDQVFGTYGTVTFNAYQIFGISRPPEGTDWEFDLGYMSERGFNAGTRFTYSQDFLFGQEAPVFGLFDAFYVDDSGLDTLGTDRVGLIPEEDQRYRLLGKHRQLLDNGWQVTAELGLISDRNFLEQYFEREWDDQKDQITGIELKRTFDNQSLALAVDYNPNDFFLRTSQLPRLDYFALGQSLWEDRLTTYGHVTGGYTQQRRATTPTAPQDAATFSPLPYEADTNGERFAWRQALEYPLAVGDIKVVPFILGEAAHWGEDLSGNDLQRVYGQAGVRTTLPFWALYPEVESELFNVHGLAHKVNFDMEYSYTDSSQNVEELPLYDEIDDDNVQHFRRRLAFQDFGGPAPVPARFDERFYGVRRGLQDNVTGPIEIVDDLSVARLGLRQRWQTKRGPPANRRIIDYVILDTHFELFPDDDQNFGETAGLLDYDFRWHVGDRVTLMSSGAADFFGDGQRYFSVGAQLNRPARGNIYVGFRSLEGPISSNILLASVNYRLSPKWVGSAGLSFDLSDNGYLGQSLSLTRIGESFLVTAAFNADQTRDNIGVMLYIEPRFLPKTRFGKRTGLEVPMAGQYGLE
ncbi:MAG: organic solvent tolerance protein OstA [Pirellulales bacterium]|nr:organic solvent tolerance protein OstA [Pirellulales bacterium]